MTLMFMPQLKDNRGQTLVIVIVAMAISLAAGLAVSSRSLTALKGVSYSNQSTTAYHAAEAGVEEALKRLSDQSFSEGLISGNIARPYSGGGTLTGASYSYTIDIGGGGMADYLLRLDKDRTAEIKLNGTYTAGTLTVCWNLPADQGESASLEMILVSGSAAGGYTLAQKIGVNGGVVRSNGFEAAGAGDGNYNYCRVVSDIPGNAQILRIKSLYNHTSAIVKPSAVLPPQSFVVNSVGRSGETLRHLEVTKSLPALPEIFDFAVFTPQDLTK